VTKERTSAATSSLRLARKVVVAVIGLSVLGFGVALIVLPGPAVVVIPIGLAILATEFLWAGKSLARMRALLLSLQAYLFTGDLAELFAA
jgi:glucose dehydrogenase